MLLSRKDIFELPTGLTIYESKFKNIDGTRGIVGGPHHVFTEIEKRFYGSRKHIYHNNTAYSKWDIKQTQTSPF